MDKELFSFLGKTSMSEWPIEVIPYVVFFMFQVYCLAWLFVNLSTMKDRVIAVKRDALNISNKAKEQAAYIDKIIPELSASYEKYSDLIRK